MADILYTYKNNVYVNLTNKCDCACTFCIRSHQDSVGEAETLWHKKDPSLEEVIAAFDAFDFEGYDELIYCGYGEPTCALDILTASARYAKEKYGIRIRVNTKPLRIIREILRPVETVRRTSGSIVIKVFYVVTLRFSVFLM